MIFRILLRWNPEQLREIEERVNEQIRADLEVSAFQEELEKAKAMGAQALFGEKYEDQVRVVRIGDFSLRAVRRHPRALYWRDRRVRFAL